MVCVILTIVIAVFVALKGDRNKCTKKEAVNHMYKIDDRNEAKRLRATTIAIANLVEW